MFQSNLLKSSRVLEGALKFLIFKCLVLFTEGLLISNNWRRLTHANSSVTLGNVLQTLYVVSRNDSRKNGRPYGN